RDDDRQPRVERAAVAPEALDDAGARLGNDPDRLRAYEEREEVQDDEDDEGSQRCVPFLVHERRGAADLNDLDLLARLEDAVLVEGAGGPDLAVDARAADPLVV